ncbi:unnamed protein product [Porites lobata]|uniref:Leucine-rich repeat-containing N-terminal plant-type domain-containing protein n=1 Tax=Porites lobata TaxID=104759 RepID=A0ABN8PN33_9CNID|nr:unnamed protein product [Porites lobata]
MLLTHGKENVLARWSRDNYYDTSFRLEKEKEASGWNSSTNEISHCFWYGITCHDNTSYIKSIVLPYNNLDGFLFLSFSTGKTLRSRYSKHPRRDAWRPQRNIWYSFLILFVLVWPSP